MDRERWPERVSAGPRWVGDGGDAASRLLPRFHRAFPSARGGRQPCAYPPPFRVGVFSGAGDPACCLAGGCSRPREPRPGTRDHPETGIGPGAANWRANGKAHPAREAVWGEGGAGLHGPSPLTRGKPRLQNLDALAGRSSQSGWRCLKPTHLALLKPKRECLAAGFDALQSPGLVPVGKSRLLSGRRARLVPPPRLVGGSSPPRAGPPLPQPWARLSEIFVSRNGRD